MTTTPDFQTYDAKLAAHAALEADIRPHNKQVLFDALAAADVSRVVICFDGSGDSGQIETADAFSADDTLMEFPTGTVAQSEAKWDGPAIATVEWTIREAVEEMAYDLLGQTHGGWGNDDGAYGEFTFDVAERSILLDYNERFTQSTNYQHEF